MSIVHSVQLNYRLRNERNGWVPVVVAARAYEVYSHMYGTHQSLDKLNSRGGFGTGELVAFLYARGFPRGEWSARVDEALSGLVI